MSTIALYSLVVFVVATLVLCNRKYLALSFVFLVPWYGLQTNVGLTMNIDRFIAAIMIFGVVARGAVPRVCYRVAAFSLYAIVDTVVHSFNLPATAQSFPPLHGQYRWLVQLVMWGLYFGPVPYLASQKWPDCIPQLGRAFVASVSMLAVLGIVQYIVFGVTGIDLFPIGMMESKAAEKTAVFISDSGAVMMRASSLGGEPKHLAYSIAVALALTEAGLFLMPRGTVSRRGRVLCVACALLVSQFLTLSTQGYILTMVNLSILAAFGFVFRIGWDMGRITRGLVYGALIFAVIAAIPAARKLVQERTVNRVTQSGAMEDWNQAVWAWLEENPQHGVLGVGLGNVHLYASGHIPDLALEHMQDQVFTAKSGALRLVSELGIVGLVLFLWMYLGPVIELMRRRREQAIAGPVACVAIVVLVDFLLSLDGPQFVFPMMGIALSAEAHGAKQAVQEPRLAVLGRA